MEDGIYEEADEKCVFSCFPIKTKHNKRTGWVKKKKKKKVDCIEGLQMSGCLKS